jgi:carbonic anhydrase
MSAKNMDEWYEKLDINYKSICAKLQQLKEKINTSEKDEKERIKSDIDKNEYLAKQYNYYIQLKH